MTTMAAHTSTWRAPEKEILPTLGVTKAQMALAWLRAQKPGIVPIPGTTKLHRREENLGAATVELTTNDLGSIEAALGRVQVQGERYPTRLAARAGR